MAYEYKYKGKTEEEIRAIKDERNAKERAKRAEKRALREALYKPKAPDLPEHVVSSMDKRSKYLFHLQTGIGRIKAAEVVGVAYATVKYWRRVDESFREKEVEILESFVDTVEDALIAQIQSDYASIGDKLRFLEKARPEKWGQKSKIEHQHTLSYDGTVEERIARLRGLLETGGRDTSVLDAYVVSDEPLAELPAASDG